MQYRKLGRSGITVSAVGCGGHREGAEMLDGLARSARFFTSPQARAAVIAAAIDQGITYFDTTFGCEIQSLGESLRILGRRDGLFCSAMRVDFFGNYLREGGDVKQYLRRELEGRLHDFGFDHVEQFLMGAMEVGDPLAHSKAILEDAFAEFARLRDQGKVRTLGFSCHDPDYAARLLDAFPAFDSVMVPYNFINRAAEGNLRQAIARTGAALIAMKTLVWHVYGLPVTLLRKLPPVPRRMNLDHTAAIGRLAIQWVLSNPQLVTCVPALNDGPSVHENASAADAPALTPDDLRTLESYAAAMSSEDFVPLGIAGLMQDNLRILANAISLIRNRLGYAGPDLDFLAADAPQQARKVADDQLRRLAQDSRWADYVPAR